MKQNKTLKTKKGAFIGKYYKTLKQAVKAYNKMSDELRQNQSICEVNGSFFILGNTQIDVITRSSLI